MGVPAEVFRARIGLYHHRWRGLRGPPSFKQHGFNPFGLSSVCVPLGVLCILLLIAGVESIPGPSGIFVCKYCKVAASTTAEYSKHLLIHSHWKNFSIPCCFCKQTFKSAASFNSHVSRFHRTMSINRPSSAPLMLSCPVTTCNMGLDSRQNYMEHVYQHLQDNNKLQTRISFKCCLGTCQSNIDDKRKFQVHMSRYHPVIEFEKTNCASEEPSQTFALNASFDEDMSADTATEIETETSETHDGNNTPEDPYPEHIIKDDIARFYLKLEGECLLASSSVQEISLEIRRLTEYTVKRIL